jgi:gamma-glutamylcyclotransferase (GGCT)/AIG2-like uncharacterized protein YtfP
MGEEVVNQQHLFVYGSMAEGMVHFEKIKSFIISAVAAKARGAIYRLKSGYPVMVSEGQDLIQGNLLELNSSDFLWHLLDEFYGCNSQDPSKSFYRRGLTDVWIEGDIKSASVYLTSPEKLPTNAQLIPGGDWQETLKNFPPISERLTDKQKNYVLRLGASSSREIVPIDMTLYRELMTLELIVDKGRRLALSQFGLELYRHLK